MISNERLYSVAVDYYEKSKTKSEIAKELGVSHVQVGKYLNLAKERGLVEIVLNPPSVHPEELDKLTLRFKELYGLEELVLVPGAASERTSHAFITEALVQYILSNYANENLRFSIGMGRLVKESGENKLRIADKRTKWKIVPALNYDREDMNNAYYDAESVSLSYIHNWGVGMDKKTKDTLSSYLKKEEAEAMDKYYLDLDFVIGGVGLPFPRNPQLRRSVFKKEDLESLTDDISGDYLNYYFDESGKILIPSTLGPYAIELETLRRIKKRIAVASGYSKIGSISSLLKTGLVNVLVTDLPTARNVLSI